LKNKKKHKKSNPEIKKGLKYYRKKQYIKAIYHLEKALREGRTEPKVYLYLGYSSLKTGDIDGARRYFRGGLIHNEGNVDLLKGLSYIYLKDERVEDAIGLWGEILEKHPLERKIKKALQKLRMSEDINEFIEQSKAEDFFSMRPPFFTRLKPYIVGVSILIFVVILGLGFYVSPLYERTLNKVFPEAARLKQVELPSNQKLASEDTEKVLYYFDDKELKNSFVKVKKLIYKNKTNQAIILLNKIMYSNALPQVKEKFKVLYKFIEPLDPLSMDHNPGFHEITKDPVAFKGVYVLWDGRIANLVKIKNGVEFDLLVNYINEDTIAGIAHVKLHGKYYLENRQKIEVFGIYRDYDKQDGKLFIDGILVKPL